MSSIISSIIRAIERLVKGPMTQKQVEIALSLLAGKKGDKLEWRTSIVDLLKLLDLDSDMGARMELAEEVGWGPGAYTGTTADNVKLHEIVMAEVAQRYIGIPKR